MSAKNHLAEHGWVVLTVLHNTMLEITKFLQSKTEGMGRQSFSNDDLHIASQKMLTKELRLSGLINKFFHENQLIFEGLMGGEFLYQDKPYLRIARPNKPQDNIGYHKDTMYGGYPQELSVVIPVYEMKDDECLRVMSGSHLIPDEEFRYIQTTSETVSKGDDKHQIGFLYAPKHMDETQLKMRPVPLRHNEVLVFSLATVHGQKVNGGTHTRWSIDTRIVRANHELDFSARPYQYVKL